MADAIAKGKRPRTTPAGKPHADQDPFIRTTSRFWTWCRTNLRAVLLGMAGIAILVAGTVYYVTFEASVGERAAADLARLRSTAASPETLMSDLEAYVGRYEGTSSADEARIILARMYLDSGRAPEAIGVLDAVKDADDRPIGFAARSLLADAQEASGDVEAALATWERLGKNARFAFQRREARASVARLYVASGRIAEAAAIYKAIAEEAEEADDLAHAGVYRIRLGELNSRLDSGAP